MTGEGHGRDVARIKCWVINTHLQLRLRIERMIEDGCERLNQLFIITFLSDASRQTRALPRRKKKHKFVQQLAHGL